MYISLLGVKKANISIKYCILLLCGKTSERSSAPVTALSGAPLSRHNQLYSFMAYNVKSTLRGPIHLVKTIQYTLCIWAYETKQFIESQPPRRDALASLLLHLCPCHAMVVHPSLSDTVMGRLTATFTTQYGLNEFEVRHPFSRVLVAWKWCSVISISLTFAVCSERARVLQIRYRVCC